ncbi:MAG: nickel-dependent lactate racemase [Spirochaetes bacterium]|nr:nickel-dependent lactate racemase [Spirochaetota bacterium]
MRVDIPYRDGSIPLSLPDDVCLIEPNDITLVSDPSLLIRSAVEAPLDAPSFEAFLSGAGKVLVIINDATRPTPTPVVFEAIGDALEAHNACFIVATGAHRAPTEEEYRFILGSSYGRFREKTASHDARDRLSLVDLGITRNGTPILLNRRVVEADRIVIIGSVEPHYFAGFTGGRKAILPGMAGYDTIQANHKLALDPRAKALEVEDNPVSQDMEDTLNFVPAGIFSIMTVLDKDQRLAFCVTGDIRTSFRKAVQNAKGIFAVRMTRPADLVISVARSPMDINLYQAQKAIENGSLATADGGVLILVASCRDGVGDEAYLNLLSSVSSPGEALRKISEGYILGYHKAAKFAQAAQRITLMAYAGLDRAVLKKAYMEKVESLQVAVDAAIATRGANARVVVLTDGTVTVPVIE